MSRSYFGLFTVVMCLPVIFCIAIAIITYQISPFFAGVMIGLVPMYIITWVFDGLLRKKDS